MRYTKKLFYTDAATDAFRFYFEHPNYIEELIWGGPRSSGPRNGSGIADPTAAAAVRKESVLEKHAADVKKWDAARKAIDRLKYEPHGEQKYFILREVFNTPFHKGMENRVRWAAGRVSASESTAWRWISRASKFWAQYRGLI